ncbi:MAG: hypothetical protein HLX51_06740 [Micrococcaceae bacterium]|nr:hypothetical protein [Micrococcaceae bacterium]
MARRNAQVFYPSYQGLASKLLDRPWTSADGMGADELSQQVQASVAADQLQQTGHTPTMRDIAPLALQEFYLALGVSEMMETNHFFFDPDELEIRDDMVMFVEDADETIAWAVPMDQVSLPDPIVYRRTVAADEPDDTGQWESTDETVSELIADILTWNYSEEDLD